METKNLLECAKEYVRDVKELQEILKSERCSFEEGSKNLQLIWLADDVSEAMRLKDYKKVEDLLPKIEKEFFENSICYLPRLLNTEHQKQ